MLDFVKRPIPWLAFSAAAFLFGECPAYALDVSSYVSAVAVPGGLGLVADGAPVPIVVADGDYAGVKRAASDLSFDIEKVGGRRPEVLDANAHIPPEALIVGTVGHSAIIDALVSAGKIDVRAIAGHWEAYVSGVVDNPVPGVERALVIAGSDKRGTIYGIYDVSAQIGVSPWYWWADVPVAHQKSIFILPGVRVDSGSAVKYRGIFLNDEAPALTGWAKEKFGGYNHTFYVHVFELLLRLKANTLWPAMWNSAFNDDDPLNPKLADEYGIVMGTSHHEPLMRAQKEWGRHGKGPWNYATNGSELRDYWAASVRRNKPYESLYTVGMRGDGDMPMSRDTNVALLERIIADQRQILAQEVNPDVTKVPQVWALYKEVQEYYEQGMTVPDDVTLLWSDDNFGNLRRVPTSEERKRVGGHGIYYHVDYVGGPRSYKWICTVPIEKIWEQMDLAYNYGADRFWMLNVGDLKPMEYDIEFFLSMARAPNDWPKERLGEFAREWCAHQFGPAHADEIASILTDYLRLNGRRKPELLEPGTYNLVSYHEADRVEAECRNLITRADTVGRSLPNEMQDAYFQLVLYPAKATAQLIELYIAAGRNQLYASQGRSQTNEIAGQVRALFQADADLSSAYNHNLSGGKWDHMMDQTHIGYTFWNEPPKNTMPEVHELAVPAAASMAIASEDSKDSWPGAPTPCELPSMDPFNHQGRIVDVFNRGSTAFDFTAVADQPWIRLRIEPATGKMDAGVPLEAAVSVRGRVQDLARVVVEADWAKAPAGLSHGNVVFSGTGTTVSVGVNAVRPARPSGDDNPGFVESGGVISIEAENTTGRREYSGVAWEPIAQYGRTQSSMALFPVTAESARPPLAPRLEYQLYAADSGNATVEAYLAPSLPFVAGRGLRIAVSIDDAPPSTVEIKATAGTPDWSRSVEDNIHIARIPVAFAGPGAHRLYVWGIDPGVVLQKIVVDFGGEKPSYLGPPESYFWDPRR
jgi:hypothetical protein